ncbi:MraY family glycosyltransferase [Algoriphagus machipongonensis]|uniref:Undecaprenyl-phosphate N-acetylglucosaminyl 1-phosphate transferase n=1 Tax=Algoriphagus machipongonensis TaxID=388413 RepID=A3HRS4_9BACT|nr:MraY family glycosyltransferase [Algoriphagus machipongonensis]EAZ82542.1 putative undecaprenyl-phosphate N-acetylglucosaminyl 1-phosphate transferase [Algoriphagus machipongonensis]
MYYFIAFLTSLATGVLFFPVLIKILNRFDIADSPGGRKIHQNVVPSMGGVGFFLAAAIALAIWGWQFNFPDMRYFLGGIAIMFFVGLRDDIVELRASRKLLGQLVSVLLVVIVADIRITSFHGFLGINELNLAGSYLFSALVLLALTNGFNLIDGLDGLAGTIAIISFSFLGAWFYYQGVESYALISFVFLGGVFAFLVFNWHPAKIFMGDTGSLTLGFTLATLIIAFMEVNEALPAGSNLKFENTFSVSVALMIFPLYDMARVFTRRISQGKGPMVPDKSHVHHFLMRMGLKHNQVAFILGFLQLVIIFLTIALKDFSDHLVLPIISSIVIYLGWRLDKVTVKYVKKKVDLAPRVLEIRELNKRKKKRILLDKESFKDSTINMN